MKAPSFFAAALVVMVASVACAQVTISREGKSDYVISIRKGATVVERTAAGELQIYLKKATGAELTVEEGAEGESVIEVKSDTTMGADAIRMKVEGKRVVLAGGGTRGVGYAVGEFLEEVVGVRWWTSSEEFVPERRTVEVRALDVSHAPRIVYRESFNRDPMGDGVFAARMRLNGHHHPVPADRGGHYSIIGWCHTSFRLVPPGEFFGKHPEWYAMDGKGKRQATQVCWSDEGLRAQMAKAVLERVRKNPAAGMISVSQEDAHGQCKCEKCRAIAAEDGSEAGPLVRGVNAVAAEVGKEYPEFLVETLAYQWSRKPPKVTRPGKKVLIRLCSIECDFAHPLAGQDFGEDLRGWAKIADHLFVWNYVTNFSNYLIPQPNLHAIGADLRFFADNHVVGVFEQGDAYNYPVGDMLPLRVWVQAKLMWDPRRDQADLVKEFMEGYYGAAGPALMEYLEVVNARSAKGEFRRGCYHHNPAMTEKDIAQAEGLFRRAAEAVKDDAVRSKRVTIQRLMLDHVKLMKYDFTGELKAKPAEVVRREYDAAATAFIAAARENGARNFSEQLGFDGYPSVLRGRAMKEVPVELPKAGAALGPGEVDVQEDRLYVWKRGELADIVDDPKASNGRAVKTKGTHEWTVQWHVGKGSPVAGKGPWRLSVVMRTAPGRTSGHGWVMGVFDPKGHVDRARLAVGAGEAGGGEYRTWGFLLDELREGEYFWVQPNGGEVWVDRVVVQRVGEGGEQ